MKGNESLGQNDRGRRTNRSCIPYTALNTYTAAWFVMQNIEKLPKVRVLLEAGTFYSAINTLLEKQGICAVKHDNDSRKKEYTVTDLGKQTLQGEPARLKELTIIGANELDVEGLHYEN